MPQHRPAGEDGANAPRDEGLVVRAGLTETIVAVALIAMAVWLWLGSYSYDEGGRGLMGPAAFPRGLAVLLGIASLILGTRGVRHLLQLAAIPTLARVLFRRPGAVMLAAVLIILYPLLLPRFGFYPTTGVWLLTLLWCAGQRNVPWALVTTLAFLVAVKLVFQMGMGIPLP